MNFPSSSRSRPRRLRLRNIVPFSSIASPGSRLGRHLVYHRDRLLFLTDPAGYRLGFASSNALC
jgi:hypothetical protein